MYAWIEHSTFCKHVFKKNAIKHSFLAVSIVASVTLYASPLVRSEVDKADLPLPYRIISEQDLSVNTASRNKRMVGGRRANTGDFPQIVQILEDNSLICTGTLIWQRGDYPRAAAILTASHCLARYKPSNDYSVVFKNIEMISDRAYRVVSKEKMPIEADSYTGNFYSDIALVFINLVGDEEFQNFLPMEVSYTEVTDDSYQKEDLDQGVTVAGYGYHGWNREIGELYYLRTSLMKPSSCHSPGNRAFQLGLQPLCTYSEENQGAWDGDSGAPLFSDKYIRKRIYGVVGSSDEFLNIEKDNTGAALLRRSEVTYYSRMTTPGVKDFIERHTGQFGTVHSDDGAVDSPIFSWGRYGSHLYRENDLGICVDNEGLQIGTVYFLGQKLPHCQFVEQGDNGKPVIRFYQIDYHSRSRLAKFLRGYVGLHYQWKNWEDNIPQADMFSTNSEDNPHRYSGDGVSEGEAGGLIPCRVLSLADRSCVDEILTTDAIEPTHPLVAQATTEAALVQPYDELPRRRELDSPKSLYYIGRFDSEAGRCIYYDAKYRTINSTCDFQVLVGRSHSHGM